MQNPLSHHDQWFFLIVIVVLVVGIAGNVWISRGESWGRFVFLWIGVASMFFLLLVFISLYQQAGAAP